MQLLIPIEKLVPFPGNVRRRNTPKDIAGLAQNIKLLAEEQAGADADPVEGLISPLVVRKAAGDEEAYEVVCGSRRRAALESLGGVHALCMVRDLTDKQAVEISAVENLQRDNLHPIEEAEAYRRMVESGMSVKAIADTAGRSASHVYQRLQLNSLEPSVLKHFWESEAPYPAQVYIQIAKLPTIEQQLNCWKEVRESHADGSLRIVNGWMRANLRELRGAAFPTDVDLEPEGGEKLASCEACKKRSDKQRNLFGGDVEGARCLDPACWDNKTEAFVQISLDNGMSGVESGWNNDERYVSPFVFSHLDKDKRPKTEKVIVLEGYDRGKVVEMVPREAVAPEDIPSWAGGKGKDPSADQAPRRMTADEKEDIDEAMALVISNIAPIDPPVAAELVFQSLRRAGIGSACIKIVARRLGVEPNVIHDMAALPADPEEAHTVLWLHLLCARCETYGDQRNSLKNLADVVKTISLGADAKQQFEELYFTWFDKAGRFRADGKERRKKRLGQSAA